MSEEKNTADLVTEACADLNKTKLRTISTIFFSFLSLSWSIYTRTTSAAIISSLKQELAACQAALQATREQCSVLYGQPEIAVGPNTNEEFEIQISLAQCSAAPIFFTELYRKREREEAYLWTQGEKPTNISLSPSSFT